MRTASVRPRSPAHAPAARCATRPTPQPSESSRRCPSCGASSTPRSGSSSWSSASRRSPPDDSAHDRVGTVSIVTVRHRAVLVFGVALLVVALTACDSGSSNDSGSASGRTTTTTATSGTTGKPLPASSYVGLTKKDAIAQAKAHDQPWRIGREDDEQFMLTQDFVPERVTFEIDDGKVTKATLG